jgi:hypothetical protein
MHSQKKGISAPFCALEKTSFNKFFQKHTSSNRIFILHTQKFYPNDATDHSCEDLIEIANIKQSAFIIV